MNVHFVRLLHDYSSTKMDINAKQTNTHTLRRERRTRENEKLKIKENGKKKKDREREGEADEDEDGVRIDNEGFLRFESNVTVFSGFIPFHSTVPFSFRC